jgi:hypothetical protein
MSFHSFATRFHCVNSLSFGERTRRAESGRAREKPIE